MSVRLLPVSAALVAALLTWLPDAAAQSRGRPKAPRPDTTTAPVAPSVDTSTHTEAPLAAMVSFRQFGSWLDDTSAPTRGAGRTGIGIGYWRVSGGSQINVPMIDVGYGFTDRIQGSASVPFYRASYQGSTARGLDDVYLSAKVTLVDPTLTVSEFGLAVSPVMEVLSTAGDDGRVHFALPISVELRRSPFRVYGSGGYFTRGSVFTGGAVEWSAASGMVMTGAITQSYSTRAEAALDSLGVSRQRVDATIGIAYPVASIAAAYVSVGRSLTSVQEGGTTLALAGGMSFRFSNARARQ